MVGTPLDRQRLSNLPSCRTLQSFEPDVTEFSFYYGLPILSLRNAVFPFILEGRRGYQVI